MATQVWFNKPKRPIDLSCLIKDVISAKRRVIVASAWFTHSQLAEVIVSATVPVKWVILNQSDLDRPGSKAAYDICVSGIPLWNHDTSEACTPWSGVLVLGSGDWKEGVMHHKFILADDVVWTGSYNLTYQAGNNYETLMRIDDVLIAKQFYDEAASLILYDSLLFDEGMGLYRRPSDAFRCIECGKLFALHDLGLDTETGGTYCVKCAGNNLSSCDGYRKKTEHLTPFRGDMSPYLEYISKQPMIGDF